MKETWVAGWKDKRRVMRRYDLTSEMYEKRYRAEQQAKYAAALENVNLAGKQVLDVGCGTGLFFSYASACASTVLGVDISRKLLLKARDEAKRLGNVSVLQADADHLPFNEGAFEAVFAFTVFQNMPKPRKTLGELKRITKSSGVVVVTGLKKAFPLNTFLDFLDGFSLQLAMFVDRENLNCYVAVLNAE
ncbi:MAG: class I SAM-dependent methyltransferase [Candidatus Bathyarchaeia archaeon]